jgi:uncharacterized protein
LEDSILNQNELIPQEPAAVPPLRKPSFLMIGLLYSLAVILLILAGSRVQRREFYTGILITEFVLIALPAVLLLFIYRYDVKRVLRLNRVSLLNCVIIIGIMCCSFPISIVLNLINLLLIKSIFGKVELAQIPTAANGMGLLIGVLVIAGSAGICEEILFRGVIMRGFERLGIVRAILITAFLFGLLHVDFQKLLGTFLLGSLIGFFVYRTNSIFAGMLAHFVNNAVAVVLSFVGYKLTEYYKSSGIGDAIQENSGNLDFSAITSLPPAQLAAVLIVYGFIFLVAAAFFIGLVYLFYRTTSRERKELPADMGTSRKVGLLGLIPGLAVVSLLYMLQGLRLRGIHLKAMEDIFILLGLR